MCVDGKSAITVILQSTTVTTDEGISTPLLAGYVVKIAVYVQKIRKNLMGLKIVSNRWYEGLSQ